MANEPLKVRTTANILRGPDMTTTDLYPAMAIISKVDLRPLGGPKRTPIQKSIHFMDKYFMLIGLVIVITLASQWPIGYNDGPLYPKITSSWMVTIILFFFIGLGIKIQYLKRACLFWQLNLFCHCMIFVYFPLIGFAIKQISLSLPEDMVSDAMSTLLDGVIILCCLPATAASAVVFTSNANGNEAASAINCTLSNLLGIFITPALIFIFAGNTGEIDGADIFMKLSLRVMAPLFVAQLIRIAGGRKGRRKIKKAKPYIRKINEVALLYMVFCSLSESFYVGIDANLVDISSIIGITILLHCHVYVVMWYIASTFRFCMKADPNSSQFMAFTVYDRIAILYSGASKTISLGIPLIETIYEGDPNLGMYLIPLLLYKPTCLIVGSLLVHPFKKLVGKERKYIVSFTTSTNLAASKSLKLDISPILITNGENNIDNTDNKKVETKSSTDYGAMTPLTPPTVSIKSNNDDPNYDPYLDHAQYANMDLVDDEDDREKEINIIDV